MGTGIDVTGYYELQAKLETEAHRFEALAEGAPVGICEIDGDNAIGFVNATLLALFNSASLEELMAQNFTMELIGDTPDASEAVGTFAALAIRLQASARESEMRLLHDGHEHHFVVRKALVARSDIERSMLPSKRAANENILIFIDITDHKAAEARIRHLAHHDPLTGALNRLAFAEELAETARSATADRPAALIAIDLDRFKPINDAYGHAAGDAILKELVSRIGRHLRPGMRLYRVGGDEFMLLTQPSADQDPLAFASGLVEAILEPFMVNGQPLSVGISAGLSVMPTDATNADTLTHYADVALYDVKRAGGGAAKAFDRAMLARADTPTTTRTVHAAALARSTSR